MAGEEPARRRISSQEPKEHEADTSQVAKEIAVSQKARMQNRLNVFYTVTHETIGTVHRDAK